MIWFLTQFGDADLLQVLPGDVSDDGDGVVAVVAQPLLILRQSNHAEPLPQIHLKPQKHAGRSESQARSRFLRYYNKSKSVFEMISHRNVIWKPLRDAQFGDLHGDLLSVAWFGHTNSCEILRTHEDERTTQTEGRSTETNINVRERHIFYSVC